jgi:imidazolonepropionase-like amidohydrolase
VLVHTWAPCHRVGMQLCKGLTATAWVVVAACGSAPSTAPVVRPAPAAPTGTGPAISPSTHDTAAKPLKEARPRTLRFAFVTAGRPAGAAEIEVATDGSRRSHFTFNDRGRGPDITTTITVDARGWPRSIHSTGHDYLKVPVEETVAVSDGIISWHSTGERGAAPVDRGFLIPTVGPFESSAMLARALWQAPAKRVALLPAGEAWIDDETTLEVEVEGIRRTIRRVAIAGLGFSPELLWLDQDGEFFASVSPWSSLIAVGAEPLIDKLVAEDARWRAARAANLAAELAQRPPTAGVAIIHARMFDSERRVMRNDVSVVIVGDRIAAVGGASTKIPAGAQVIDAGGKTLIPGLWDMHVHLGDDDGILHLAMGVTSVRDLGNQADALGKRKARFDAGTELGPRVLRGGLIDGPGELAAPTGALASSIEQARVHVARFAELGYQQIKLYSSLDPALVPGIAKEAHARGLRVSGHIPNGMTAAQAVEAGYDEIQHANMLFLNFLAKPGDDTRGPLRFGLVAAQAAALDLASPQVRAFLALLAKHKTVLDPTLMTFEGMFNSEPADPNPAMVPYFGRLPAQVERGSRGGGLPAPADQRATFRASHAAMGKLVKLAWQRGIRIVAGTDATAGLSLPRELELYVAAGIPAPDVLALATIGAARVMGKQSELGSIAVGKLADLVLLDGDPSTNIGAVRNATLVVSRGVLFDPARLFPAVGMRAR